MISALVKPISLIPAANTARYDELGGPGDGGLLEPRVSVGILSIGFKEMSKSIGPLFVCVASPGFGKVSGKKISSVSLRFSSPVWPGDSLQVNGWHANEDNNTLRFEVENSSDIKVIKSGKLSIIG